MSQSLSTRYQVINDKARELVAEIVSIEKDRGKKLAKMIRVLTDMNILFKSKPTEEKLGKYKDFEHWLEATISPLEGLEKRNAYYYIHVGKNLLLKRLLTDEQVEEMGVEKAKVLAKYTEQKGKLPQPLIDRALSDDVTAKELKKEVQGLVPGQFQYQGGQWSTIEVRGPEEHCSWLRAFLQLVRRQEGHKPSDAELLRDLLALHEQELREAEEKRRKEIAGTA